MRVKRANIFYVSSFPKTNLHLVATWKLIGGTNTLSGTLTLPYMSVLLSPVIRYISALITNKCPLFPGSKRLIRDSNKTFEILTDIHNTRFKMADTALVYSELPAHQWSLVTFSDFFQFTICVSFRSEIKQKLFQLVETSFIILDKLISTHNLF